MANILSFKIFILSMLVILLIGFAFLGLMYLFLNPSTASTPLSLQKPVTTEPVSLTLNLSSPDNNLLVFDPDILVQGQTSEGATVILDTDNADFVPDLSGGNFSATVKLQPGLNQLTVTSFDDTGNSKSENRVVYYSTEKI